MKVKKDTTIRKNTFLVWIVDVDEESEMTAGRELQVEGYGGRRASPFRSIFPTGFPFQERK